jgi:hypothetical protein
MIMFDEALDIAIDVLRARFPETLPTIHIVRNPFGAIIVTIPDDLLASADREELARRLDSRLAQYSLGVRRILFEERELIDPCDVLESQDKVQVPGYPSVFLVERMLTNQDWVRAPLSDKPPIPTLVAFSLKGGVGQTTALAMLAWHLARCGKRVLVIDLDLEEPGIGSMLAPILPAFGLVDWLAECLNRPADSALLKRCVAECPIALETPGTVSVMPAYGTQTRNYVSKLGRIYTPSMNDDGQLIGLAERLFDLIRLVQDLPGHPEIVLMDTRSGFHDIGSAAMTRLGAQVLLFTRNDKQDWWAYRRLFEHLRSANSVSEKMGSESNLRQRVKIVGAQSVPHDDIRRDWVHASYGAWNSFYANEPAEAQGDVEFAASDKANVKAPYYPLFINFDPAVRSWSLIDSAAKPDWNIVQRIFGDFFAGVEDRIGESTVEPNGGNVPPQA